MKLVPIQSNIDPVQVNWMQKRNLDLVTEIDTLSFTDSLNKEDFTALLRRKEMIGSTIEVNYELVGYLIYGLHKNSLTIERMAVYPSKRKKGYGRFAIARLIDKLMVQRRYSIYVNVPEDNLDAQLFFRKMGFAATNLLDNMIMMTYSLFPEEMSWSS
jgi:[ribosomal protein S18]-alanine N-acetyltransferase